MEVEDKENVILDHIQRATIRFLVNFSSETMSAIQQWNDI